MIKFSQQLSLEFVSQPAHGHDPARVRRVIFELFAQVAHVHVHRAVVVDIIFIPPDDLNELGPFEGVVGMAGKRA
jgi:hypothetical protein